MNNDLYEYLTSRMNPEEIAFNEVQSDTSYNPPMEAFGEDYYNYSDYGLGETYDDRYGQTGYSLGGNLKNLFGSFGVDKEQAIDSFKGIGGNISVGFNNLFNALNKGNPYLGALDVAGGVMGAIGEYNADQRGVDAYRALADKAQARAGTYLDRAESYRTGDAINSAFNQNLDIAMTNANAVNRNMLSKGIDSASMMKENLSQATDRANIANQRTRQQFNQYADTQQNIYDTVMAQADQLDAQADMLDNKKWWEYGASAINSIIS